MISSLRNVSVPDALLRWAVLPLSAGVLFACEKPKPAPKEVIRPVKMLEVGGGAAITGEYPGKVAAKIQSEMGFEVPGKLISLPVKEGQRMKKGQIIAKIDPRDYEARLSSERARLREAKLNYGRAKELYAANSIALAQLDAERKKFEVIQATYREATKGLEDTLIRAPFDGVVARKMMKEFTNVRAKETVVIFQDDSDLEIDINVPERVWATVSDKTPDDLSKQIKPNVVITSLPGMQFPATIKEAATIADPTTRTFKVTFAFKAPAGAKVLPGMSAKVMVDEERDDSDPKTRTKVVPSRAVFSDQSGKSFVWVIDPKSMKASKRAVKSGSIVSDKIEIGDGLNAGELIATSGVYHLKEGMKVKRLVKRRK